MVFKRNNYSFILFIFIISFINITKENEVHNSINYIIILLQLSFPNFKGHLRKLWNEDIDEGLYRKIDSAEEESIKHCKNSDYKYFIYYVTGQNYTFDQYINYDNAVSNI